MKRTLLAAAIALSAIASGASATTITFTPLTTAGQGFVSVQGAPYVESGYQLQTGALGFGSARTGDVAPGFIFDGQPMTWYYGSTSLFNDDLSGASETTLSSVDGSAFNLSSIDLTALNNYYTFTVDGQEGSAAGENVSFTGNIHGGGTVTDTVHISNETAFSTFNFTGFTDLDSVVFDIALPGGHGGAGFQFDNIVLAKFSSDTGPGTGGTPSVPEPASIALMGLGLAGLFAFGRRKQA